MAPSGTLDVPIDSTSGYESVGMSDVNTAITERLTLKLQQVRDGYLCGSTTLLGVRFEVEAFRVRADRFNEPDNARPARTVEVLQGLLIDDVPLYQVELPGHEGLWLLFIYPAENTRYAGPDR